MDRGWARKKTPSKLKRLKMRPISLFIYRLIFLLTNIGRLLLNLMN